MIRRATVADVPAAARIINDCAEYGLMLPRSLASMYENVREFHVAVHAAPEERSDEGAGIADGERVIGVCGLSIVWADLAEVVALAVAPDHRGKGLGKQLVTACLNEARELGIRRVMTLTYEQAFFEKLGFCVVDRQQLPLKVWSECVRCPKNQACDEIAMIRVMEDVPEFSAPAPRQNAHSAPGHFVVPVTLTTTRTRTGPCAALPEYE